MSLTDKTCKHIANLASQQEALNQFIFAEFDDRELADLTDKLAAIKRRRKGPPEGRDRFLKPADRDRFRGRASSGGRPSSPR